MLQTMIIREASMADLEAISKLESECFSIAEAAGIDEFSSRLTYYKEHFLLMFDGNRLISFIDGFVSDKKDLTDEMYENAHMHNEFGDWQMVFGLVTHPDYRCRGCAGRIIERFSDLARAQNRLGLVLTCKEGLIPFYEKHCFVNEGVSVSAHGNALWYQMRLTF